jgi:hypothetical protein
MQLFPIILMLMWATGLRLRLLLNSEQIHQSCFSAASPRHRDQSFSRQAFSFGGDADIEYAILSLCTTYQLALINLH